MKVDFVKLAELGPGDRPHKAYMIRLDKGYVRLMSSRVDAGGMVVSINYYGHEDEAGRMLELTRVLEKRQERAAFESDLAEFRRLIEGEGFKMVVYELGPGGDGGG